MTTITAARHPTELALVTDRLLVTVRDSATRRYRPVGFLGWQDDEYHFSYLRREIRRPGFRPLPGLRRATARTLRSKTLFPLFAERVISHRRPDRAATLTALDLPLAAAPMEVLARSHGHRVGDTIELLPAPTAGPGEAVSFVFLAHGVRYLTADEQARIESLRPGQGLKLRRDADNRVNPRAQFVTDEHDVRFGWVPDPLIDVIEDVEEQRLTVERANGAEAGFHFRLLVRFAGRVRNDRALFAGPDWATV